jgi:hypothetical protein
MYFQMRRDADQWFKDISGSFATKFDLYYLCLMAGFAARRKSELESASGTDILDYFPHEFRTRGSLIISLLISTELSVAGIDLNERDAVNRTISKLVTPDTTSKLADEGVRLMNRYASGGFEALIEHFDDRPRTIETFLRTYHSIIERLRSEVTASAMRSPDV